MAVNVTKKEFVRPWDIGGVAKLWEWCVNRQAGIFPYLLRKSNEGGGGDIRLENPRFAGRWAGDVVYLIGDYDASKLYEIADAEYRRSICDSRWVSRPAHRCSRTGLESFPSPGSSAMRPLSWVPFRGL
jgi:hypothetical protein